MNALIVMALPEESQGRIEQITPHILYTGVGKVNAAMQLTNYLNRYACDVVINLGSAGSHSLPVLSLVQCTAFFQHDMDAQVFGYAPYQTPREDQIALASDIVTDLPQHTLYTGDSFVANVARHYEVIDMEGYALAKACQFLEKPFVCVKFISDNANDAAPESWPQTLDKGSKLLAEFLKNYLKKLGADHTACAT